MNRKTFIASVIAFVAIPFRRFRRSKPPFVMGEFSKENKWVTPILYIRKK